MALADQPDHSAPARALPLRLWPAVWALLHDHGQQDHWPAELTKRCEVTAKKPLPRDSATIANERQPLTEISVTDSQAAVIRAMVGGMTQKAAADTAGVSEFTVSRWVNSDAHFIAALNLARADAWATHRAELGGLLKEARETLREILEGLGGVDPAVRLKAAALVLSEFTQPPAGPSTVEDAELLLAERHKERWQRDQRAYISLNDVILSSML
jgi:hypothetical protein